MSAVNTLTTHHTLYYSESCQLLHSIYTILVICLVGWGWGWVLNEAMETRYAVVPYSMFIVQEYTIESLNYAIYLPIGIALEKWPTDMPRMPRHFITIPNVAHYWLPLAALLWLGEFHDGISLNNLITRGRVSAADKRRLNMAVKLGLYQALVGNSK